MDAASILTAYNGLKYVKDSLGTLVQGKIEIETQARINEALSKLGAAQDTLFELREELFRLQGENAKLSGQLAQEKAWQAKASTYELAKTSGGAVVYQFRGTPEHYACPACMNEQKVQILQDNRTMSGKYRCVACEAEYPVNPQQRLDPINY
jgi:hypothetical protein